MDGKSPFDFFDPLIFTEYRSSSPTLIIWSVFLGVSIALVASWYNRRVLGKLVEKLIALGADSPSNAKTLKEAGCGNNLFLRFSLRKGSALRKTVKSEDGMTFYIPADKADGASFRYARKGSSFGWIVFGILIFAAVALAASIFYPAIASWVSSVVGL